MRNSLADVVAAALRVLDAQGLENCSMRRVAAELEVQPSALYHHVADKQSLLALMADEIVRSGEVVMGAEIVRGVESTGPGGAGSDPAAERDAATGPSGVSGRADAFGATGPRVPDPDSGKDAARRLCLRLRDAMLAVRDGADVVATAAAFRLGSSAVEDRIAALVGRDGARTLLLYTFGQTQQTQTHRQAAAFGALVGSAPAGSPGDGGSASVDDLDASFARGLDIILAGLALS